MKPTSEEIAKRMDIPLWEVRKVLKNAQQPISLETPIGEQEDSHLGDFIEDRGVVSLNPRGAERNYDVGPEGKQFVVILPASSSTQNPTRQPPPQINIVLNWLEELKQRVPVKSPATPLPVNDSSLTRSPTSAAKEVAVKKREPRITINRPALWIRAALSAASSCIRRPHHG